MNRDTVVGVVGAAVLVIAMVGIFQYESGRASILTGGDPSEWVLHKMGGPRVSATTAYQSSTEETLEVTQTDLTAVTFTLTWTAGQGSDTLKLHVVPPEGSDLRASENPAESDTGKVTVTFPVANANPAEAGGPGQTPGTGAWTVHVEFTRATGVQEIPGVGPIQGDEEVAWTLETELQHYQRAES